MVKSLDPEFIASTMDFKDQHREESTLRAAFAMLDKDKDGKITAKELKDILGSQEQFKNTSDDFWEELIREVDLNGDGEVQLVLVSSILTSLFR